MQIKGLTLDVIGDRFLDLLPMLVIAVIGTIVLELTVYFILHRVLKSRFALPYTLVAPAAVALLLFTVYPFVYNIRLAFSDLRLKTMACYIPNTDITNAPCSLGQAALNAEVEAALDGMPLRAEPSDAADVLLTLGQGDTLFVTGRSKAAGYVASSGVATTEEGRVCNPLDRECIAAQRENQAQSAVQDERDWWEVRADNDVTGWIPNNTFFMPQGVDVYAESLGGGDVLGNVAEDQEVRLVTRESQTWYEVTTEDGVTGWVTVEPNQSNLYIAGADTPLYEERSLQTETVTSLAPDAEARLLREEPVVWTAVTLESGETGWLNAELNETELYHTESETPVYPEYGIITEEPVSTLESGAQAAIVSENSQTWYLVSTLDGLQGWTNGLLGTSDAVTLTEDTEILSEIGGDASVGSAAGGDIVVLLTTTVQDDEPWSQILTNSGVNGWIQFEATELTEITYLQEPALLLSEAGSGEVAAELSNGTQLQELDSTSVTWYQIQFSEGETGWVSAPPSEITTVYATIDEAPAYAEFGSTETEVETIPAETDLTVSERREEIWYQVQTSEGIGWTTIAPREIQTIATLPEAADAHSDPSQSAEAVASVAEGQRVELGESQVGYWYQIRTAQDDDELVGWVSAQPREEITTEREIVLYSLDYGWDNFKRVFVSEDPATGEVQGWGRLLQTENSTFPRLMANTVIWTFSNVIFHTIFGMILALLLNQEGLRFRAIYRTILILPWAIPQVIIVLAWRGEFNFQFGFVNTMLKDLGLDPVNWLQSPTEAFFAVTFVNIWLGIPFYMVTLLGGLQSIPGDYYEAAEMDGANFWNRFRSITVPLIRPVAVPIVTLDVIWTFNNFNVIYMITEGRPNESTNILVTALYNAAFGRNGSFQLGFASAFSLVIFAVLFLFAIVWITQSGALKGIYEK
jgi:ABC-type sugar transport system permease subunit/uncharacterized protein YgiM (DUF1202 family)